MPSAPKSGDKEREKERDTEMGGGGMKNVPWDRERKKKEKKQREFRQKSQAVNELIYWLSSLSLYQVLPAAAWQEYSSCTSFSL